MFDQDIEDKQESTVLFEPDASDTLEYYKQKPLIIGQKWCCVEADIKSYGALISAQCWAGDAQNAWQSLQDLQVPMGGIDRRVVDPTGTPGTPCVPLKHLLYLAVYGRLGRGNDPKRPQNSGW